MCGENGELQNLTEDGHIRLCVLAKALHQTGSMLDVDEPASLCPTPRPRWWRCACSAAAAASFRRVMMFVAWNHPAAVRWREDHPGPCSTGKPDTQADIRRWWSLMLPFDKAIHGQLLAAIGTKAKKR